MDELRAWGSVEILDRFGHGSVNEVVAVRVDGRTRVARRGTRSGADLDWELALLADLDSAGLAVPQVVPTRDGHVRHGSVIVMEYVEGRTPQDDRDHGLVVDYLKRLHLLTVDRVSQRPGWITLSQLASASRSGPVDVASLPSDVVARCRAAWELLDGLETSVVHGDPNRSNVRIDADDRVVLLDWDEARVDHAALDLSRRWMPLDATGLDEETSRIAGQAFAAWEAAMFWHSNNPHARGMLDMLP